jgi:hypothetical protein
MFKYKEYCIDGETWKDIPGYEKLYQASDLGRIRSVDGKKTFTKHHGVRTWKGRILKNKTKIPVKSGYKVTLWKGGEYKDFLVARLICTTFNGVIDETLPIKKRMTVNHKDGDRLNNNYNNLEWLTIKENIQHAFETGLMHQKNIILQGDDGVKRFFMSLSKASFFLNHSHGYVSNNIKKNRILKKGNEIFKIIKIIKN